MKMMTMKMKMKTRAMRRLTEKEDQLEEKTNINKKRKDLMFINYLKNKQRRVLMKNMKVKMMEETLRSV
jgi:hypothetical protein